MNTNKILELLRAEIKHLKIDVYDEAHQFDLGARSSLTSLESFIDSLQQDMQDNEDIDKVAQELYEHLYELKRRNNVPTNLYNKQEIIDLWKAGIVYRRSHPKQEQPEVECEDLEDEIDRVIADYSFTKTIDSGGLKTTVLDYEKIAHHFAEWGADHFRDTTKMMSDDLEEAAREIVIKMHPCMKDCTILGDRLTRGQLMALVKAGAEWQSKKAQETIKTAEDHAFLAGADWQKEQNKMMACKWFRNGGECGKGLPGTPCELEGCVAWEHSEEE